MILFQIFYRRTEEEAKANLALIDKAAAESKGMTSLAKAAAEKYFTVTQWPQWVKDQFEPIGFFLDDNHVYSVRLGEESEALSMHDWFYKEWRPWAVQQPGDKGEFAKHLLAHAIDDQGAFDKMESF